MQSTHAYVKRYNYLSLFLCSVLKLGVGIVTDVQRLESAFGVHTAGYVDLQHVAVRSGVR